MLGHRHAVSETVDKKKMVKTEMWTAQKIQRKQ